MVSASASCFHGELRLTCSFSLESPFSLAESWRQFLRQQSCDPRQPTGRFTAPTRKLSYLIEWHRLTLVLHQSHIPSRQACGKGIGFPSFDVQSFLRRTGTGLIGINPGGNDVLACRQVATIASSL